MDTSRQKDFAVNRKAGFEYFIDERLEAGLVLEGWEAKTIRTQGLSLDGAFVYLRDGEAYLNNAHVAPLDTAVHGFLRPEPTRARKLLLHSREISRLIGTVERRGMTLVPLRVYAVKGRIKVEIGVARGKKLYDKRESLKQKAVDRDVAREMRAR
jgi:SsrA-binding protein